MALPLAAWLGAEVWTSYRQEQSRRDELRMEENRFLEKLTAEVQGTLELANDAFDARTPFRDGCRRVVMDSRGQQGAGFADECLKQYLEAIHKLDLAMNRLSWQVSMLALVSPETYQRWKQLKETYWAECSTGPVKTCGWRQQLLTGVDGYRDADRVRGLPIGLRYCHGDRASAPECESAAGTLRDETLKPLDDAFNTFFCSFAVDLNRIRLAIYRERERDMVEGEQKNLAKSAVFGYGQLVSVLEQNLTSSTCLAMLEKGATSQSSPTSTTPSR